MENRKTTIFGLLVIALCIVMLILIIYNATRKPYTMETENNGVFINCNITYDVEIEQMNVLDVSLYLKHDSHGEMRATGIYSTPQYNEFLRSGDITFAFRIAGDCDDYKVDRLVIRGMTPRREEKEWVFD